MLGANMSCARDLLPLWRVEHSLDLLPQMCCPWQNILFHARCLVLGCSIQCTSFSSVASSTWEGRSPCMKLATFSILLWALKKNSRPKGICCNRSWMSWDPWTLHLSLICRATGSHSLPGWVSAVPCHVRARQGGSKACPNGPRLPQGNLTIVLIGETGGAQATGLVQSLLFLRPASWMG